ncbi:MAG: endonuclease III [Pyrinomonadaceae bacterium]|nr:endonuclease III [Sphingobacteriaceae bacterium]
MLKQDRFKAFVEYFSTHQPDAQTELNYTNPFELLVAVILSAQCTDKRINQITPFLFEKYPDAYALALASSEEVFEYIRSVSYPNNKSKHLVGMAKLLVEKFNGEVPSSMEDLQTLPGVGRKTANVITSVVYEAPAMAVDTHVFRVANRLGLTRNATTPLAVEKQLVKYLPQDTIRHSHHWLILHGRYICLARRPKCEVCPLTWFCKYFAYQQTATALTKAAVAERKKDRELKQRRKANKLSTVLKKFEVKE